MNALIIARKTQYQINLKYIEKNIAKVCLLILKWGNSGEWENLRSVIFTIFVSGVADILLSLELKVF